MTTVSDEVVSGRSVRPVTRTKHYSSGGGYQETKNETTTHYRNQRSVLCPDCLSERRLRKLVEAILILVLVAVGAIWLFTRSSPVTKAASADQSLSNAAVNSVAVSASDEPATVESDSPVEKTDQTPQLVDGEADRVESPEINETAEVAQAVSNSTLTANTPEIADAVTEAVRSGNPTRWKIGDHQGYAVASSARSDGCKSVYFSDDKLGTSWVSDIKIVCP